MASGNPLNAHSASLIWTVTEGRGAEVSHNSQLSWGREHWQYSHHARVRVQSLESSPHRQAWKTINGGIQFPLTHSEKSHETNRSSLLPGIYSVTQCMQSQMRHPFSVSLLRIMQNQLYQNSRVCSSQKYFQIISKAVNRRDKWAFRVLIIQLMKSTNIYISCGFGPKY